MVTTKCWYDYDKVELTIWYKNNIIKIDPGVVEGTDFMNELDILESLLLDEDKSMIIEIEEYDED
jgi:hypothetical protein